jgi:putative MATE family efflux protein
MKSDPSSRSIREQTLATMNIAPLLVQMALPATVAMIVGATYNLVDAIFVGRGVGTAGIGALAVAFPVQMILIATGGLLGVGATSLVSRGLGSGDRERSRRAGGSTLSVAVLFGLAVIVAVTAAIGPLLTLLGAQGSIVPLARDYLGIVILGAPFAVVSMAGNAVIRAEGRARIAMVNMVSGTVVNIVLDPLFIFTFGMGIRGAAIATVIGRGVSALLVFGFFATGKSALDLRLSDLRPRLSVVGEMVGVGLGSFVRQVGFSFMFAVLINLLGRYGAPIYVSAYGAYHRLMVFFLLPVLGVAQGHQPIAGYNFGAGQLHRVRRVTLLSLGTATAIATGAGVILVSFPGTLLRMFSDDAELRAAGAQVARIVALSMPASGIIQIAAALYQAMGKGLPAVVLGSIRYVLLIPLMFLMGRTLSVQGVLAAMPISTALAAAIAAVLLTRELRALRRAPTTSA